MYDGVRGRKTKVARKLLRFPSTRFNIPHNFQQAQIHTDIWQKQEIISDAGRVRPFFLCLYLSFIAPKNHVIGTKYWEETYKSSRFVPIF